MKKTKQSAGLLLFRFNQKRPEFFLIHPGGPYWAKKDTGAWSIPKGEFEENEDSLDAAKREFKEETGKEANGKFIPLRPVKQKSGKLIFAWAFEGDLDPDNFKSNHFEMEWPPRSGRMVQFPEADKGEWFDLSTAKEKIIAGQLDFIEQCVSMLFK